MIELYTPMAGGLAREALNSLALLIGTGTFKSAVNIAFTLGVGGAAYQYVTGNKLKSLLNFIVMSFCILYILLGIKCPVAITDMQNPMKAYTVDDVPLGA